ncbi:putative glycosyltransferase STELLO1, partial [Cucurbita argyrosperma subsp. argyrosperma]
MRLLLLSQGAPDSAAFLMLATLSPKPLTSFICPISTLITCSSHCRQVFDLRPLLASDRWIVVSVSVLSFPHSPAKACVKLRWQVLAVGNSRRSIGWSLRELYFYDRGEVIDGDLGKHFDLKLSNVIHLQERILQFDFENPNKTVVNPYIHSGQRSEGISNGLPDVDSVFYFTRKTRSEALNIRFDEHAPKVALPHGVMGLWGTEAFMGSRRFCSGLVKFLTSWRSNKATFFEKALELSHSMAEEGFWKDNDVKLSVAWLQDLVSVGEEEEEAMSVSVSVSIMGGVFVPQKLPGFSSGVEESETVNFEIGKLVRWRKKFGNVVDDLSMAGQIGSGGKLLWSSYTKGFLFLQDNTILNYWNLLQADKDKLWITYKVPQSWSRVSDDSVWFGKQASWVKKVVSTMPVDFQVNYKESNPTARYLVICNCEVFYVPRQFVGDFKDLVALVGNYKIDYRVAVPMFFMAMDLPLNFDDVFGRMVYKKTPAEQLISNDTNLYAAEVPAVHPWRVSSEVEFAELMRLMAAGDPLLKELV